MSKKINISMSKKKMPQTSDAWVGANSNKRLTVDLPGELHSKLKAKVAQNNKSITNVVIEMIKNYVEKT